MYHQVLYQAADKLSNTLQNNKIDPIGIALFIGAIATVAVSAYGLWYGYRELKKPFSIKKYKTN
jgi:hypothetical protein